MKHITLQDLAPLELEELKFCVEGLGFYTKAEVEFIYNNLSRDEDGLVWYYILDKGNKTLFPLYTD